MPEATSTKPPAPDLAFREMRATEDDLQLFKSCFESNGSARDMAHLRWQYLDNPTRRVFVDFAMTKGADPMVAGIYSVMPVQMKVGSETHLGAQSVDTLTDARFRGQGLFVKMARSVYARCEANGCAIVYGVPNGSSAHGFFTKLEWASLDPLPFLVRPLRTRYVTGKLVRASVAKWIPDAPIPVFGRGAGRGQRIEPIVAFDDSCSELWRKFCTNVPVAVVRDATYLNWRFGAKPDGGYKTLGLYQGAELRGFVTFKLLNKHGGRVGYIMELLHEPNRVDVGTRLLASALGEIADGGGDAVLAWNFGHSPNHGAFRRTGFLPLPTQLRPIELHLGARGFGTSVDVKDRANWYVSYCDSDTV